MKRKGRLQAAFGKAIKKYRLTAGLSQEGLAEMADLHRTYVGDVERGERNVSLINMWKIAEASNAKLSRIMKDVEKELEK